jgi:lipid-binding SYLF domain-containing protein
MRTVLIASAVCLAVAGADAAVNTSPKARLAAAARVVRDVQTAIPAGYWDTARCVVVFPELRNTEFVVGGKHGKGVMTCRTGDRWSAPAFIEIEKGKRMFQVGADQLAVVLLVMTESAVQTLMRQEVTLGADVSVAPGPIGVQAHTDFNTPAADVLTYTRAQGLYMNLAGGVLEPDDSANSDVYGHGASLRTILSGRGLPPRTGAYGFLAELSNQPAAPGAAAQWRSAPSAGAPPSVPAAVPAVAGSNLRARVVEMQQNLDRLLADTTPRPVGTSGTIGRAQQETVPIDRARLEQIRLQLSAILAALNKP